MWIPETRDPRKTTPAASQRLNHIAPDLGDEWTKREAAGSDPAVVYDHCEGHTIGIRFLFDGAILQTWVTAGPNLPPLPEAGTAQERADTQAANDARLRSGRSWHSAIRTRQADDLAAALAALLCEQLIPALAVKPHHVRPTENSQPAEKPPASATRKRRTPKTKGNQK